MIELTQKEIEELLTVIDNTMMMLGAHEDAKEIKLLERIIKKLKEANNG